MLTAIPELRSIRIIPLQPVRAVASRPQQASPCATCHLKDSCLPSSLEDGEMQQLDELTFGRRRLKAGQMLYSAGTAFGFVYAVRSGTFKSSLSLPDGREQVSGFHMAAELMGLDGLAHGRHASSATALEDAEVCAIPYSQLSGTTSGSPALQAVVARLMSREIVREHSLMLLLGSMNTEERLAAFLLNISHRMKARGWSPREFHLRMSRAEIGSYLGVTLETVSRTFSAFQQQGLLEVDKRHICILDFERLARRVELRLH